MSHPTVHDVSQIAATQDPVVRNLQITECYAELALAASRLVGSGANWCAFATWASKQAGQSIRGEDLDAAVRDRIESSAELQILLRAVGRQLERLNKDADVQKLRESILRALNPQAAISRAAEAVARGNLKVFAEIAKEFARFVDAFDDARAVTPDGIESFCKGLRAGEPPEGQRLLRDAFRTYGAACVTDDESERAQLLFYGNLLIGLHEQTRLQRDIQDAMGASLGDPTQVRQRLLKAILPGFWVRLRLRIARLLKRELPLDALLGQLIDHVQQQIQQVTTRALMTLRLPQGRTLRLGRDLDQTFPPALATLTNAELITLLADIDPTLDSTSESAAVDWSDFHDRMHFITDLFRCYHGWAPLFDPPFTAEQVDRLKAGRRPAGRL